MSIIDLRAMRIGEFREFQTHGHTFMVKRLRRREYHLMAFHIQHRSRFGTAEQIMEDVEWVTECGVLPCSGERW